jgi:hypothetical protein
MISRSFCQEGEQAGQKRSAFFVFLFSQFFGQKLLKFYQMDVFEKRSIRILAYFYAQFFSPTGDRFCNKNGLAKNLQKIRK